MNFYLKYTTNVSADMYFWWIVAVDYKSKILYSKVKKKLNHAAHLIKNE